MSDLIEGNKRKKMLDLIEGEAGMVLSRTATGFEWRPMTLEEILEEEKEKQAHRSMCVVCNY